jgi:hypothetical protein
MVSMGDSEEEIKTLSRRWQVCKRRRNHAFGFFDQTPDILEWLKAQGKSYQTHINVILRAYVESQKKRR